MNTKHYLSHTSEYKVWTKINSIFSTEESWKKSFEIFILDVGQRPNENFFFLRDDKTKGFTKENARWQLKSIRYSGNSKKDEYQSWFSMKQRCLNPMHKAYSRYGGRGITICERWMDFKNFLEDMGNKPASYFSIERKDNNGNYCKENCKWASPAEQAINCSSNRLITFNGETKTMSEWAFIKGINYQTLVSRIDRNKWTLEKALKS